MLRQLVEKGGTPLWRELFAILYAHDVHSEGYNADSGHPGPSPCTCAALVITCNEVAEKNVVIVFFKCIAEGKRENQMLKGQLIRTAITRHNRIIVW